MIGGVLNENGSWGGSKMGEGSSGIGGGNVNIGEG